MRRQASATPDRRPELVILCGIPGSGKTTLYETEFAKTHVHISLDTIASGSRAKEWKAFSAAIGRGDSIVIDNTDLTPKHRERYIQPAKAAGYKIVGIELAITVTEALRRLETRERKIPEAAVRARANELVSIKRDEGFDALCPCL